METHDPLDEEEETPEGCCDICGMPFEGCPAEKEERQYSHRACVGM